MGKSPAKWIKTLLSGKKSSKSNLSKYATLDNETPITDNAPSDDSTVISSPMRLVVHASGELIVEVVRTANEDEFIRLGEAATKAQAVFRGYIARRAFWALKGIIRLQALVRGHLVRRQAIATLSCMRAIVEFQALARGRKVRLSGNNVNRVLQNYTPGELKDKKRADLLGTCLRTEKLSTNAFGTKLVASSHTTTPLSFQYDPVDPNAATKWLDRWSSSHFWDPLPRLKTIKPKIRTGRPKRSFQKVPPANLDTSNIKPKHHVKKAAPHQSESIQEQPDNEPKKVKHSLQNKIVSTVAASEKSKLEKEIKQKGNDLNEALLVPSLVELNYNKEYISSKENMKTRRKSFPAKQENAENVGPVFKSYMTETESVKARLRAHGSAEDGGENGVVRRHSFLSPTVKLSLPSPQVPKPLQANVQGWCKSYKSKISPRADKMVRAGWKW